MAVEPKVTVSGDGRMLLLTRTGVSLATLDAVGLIKLDALLRRTGAGELGTATRICICIGENNNIM